MNGSFQLINAILEPLKEGKISLDTGKQLSIMKLGNFC